MSIDKRFHVLAAERKRSKQLRLRRITVGVLMVIGYGLAVWGLGSP